MDAREGRGGETSGRYIDMCYGYITAEAYTHTYSGRAPGGGGVYGELSLHLLSASPAAGRPVRAGTTSGEGGINNNNNSITPILRLYLIVRPY